VKAALTLPTWTGEPHPSPTRPRAIQLFALVLGALLAVSAASAPDSPGLPDQSEAAESATFVPADYPRSETPDEGAGGSSHSGSPGSPETPSSTEHPLRPYTATYKTSARGLSLTLNRSLSMDDNGECRLTSEGRILVAGIQEVSVFTVEGEQIKPRSYVYQLSGPVSRRREVHFDPTADVIRSLYKKEWYELPKQPGTLDRMSQQEQLRLLLLNDPTPQDDIVLRVADGRKIKNYQLRFAGEEIIDTPMGPVITLMFEREHDEPERRSAFWVAPAWDYLMVKTLHVEDGRTTEANLISASIEGTPLRGDSSA